jgi:hypothetical protein
MDQELKTRWTTALRSGEYAQGYGALRKPAEEEGRPDEFCCLGVLCDIVNPEGWSLKAGRYQFESGYESYPPESVADDNGLPWAPQSELAHRNDNAASFAEIADWIDENL